MSLESSRVVTVATITTRAVPTEEFRCRTAALRSGASSSGEGERVPRRAEIEGHGLWFYYHEESTSCLTWQSAGNTERRCASKMARSWPVICQPSCIERSAAFSPSTATRLTRRGRPRNDGSRPIGCEER